MSHEPAKLTQVDKYPKKGTARRINVWHLLLRCPVCGKEFHRLMNTKPMRFRCVGLDALVAAKET